ncbi:MAG TPA: hypothetical protein VHO70_15955 [Chitinispirillaceae bacterium]|nr:hypothetical protein [Chitinispirillaceae bacterium]
MSVITIKRLFFFFLIISIFISNFSFSVAGEAEQWAKHPEWLWFDDFESSKTLKENYQDIGDAGLGISTIDAFEGTHSLAQHYDSGQVDAGWIIRVNNEGFPSHLFMRWYHKFENGFDGLPPKMARMRYRQRNGDWKSTYAVHCWIDNGLVVADVTAKKSSQANNTGYLPIAKSNFSFKNPENIGRWICFEMEVLLNKPGAADGIYRIWADDSLIIERKNVDLRGSDSTPVNEVMLDCYWNGGSPKAQNRYYDNFIISTKKIGPIQKTTGTNKINSEKKPKNNSSSSLQGFLHHNKKWYNGVYCTNFTGIEKVVFH